VDGLSGKVFLITGGTEGIGFASAKLALQQGARVAITGRNAEKGAAAIQSLGQHAEQVRFFVQDAADPASWLRVINQVEQSFVGLHVLVNNAGLHIARPFMDTSIEAFDAVFNLNVRGVFAGIQAAVPLIRKSLGKDEYGAIINVSSGAAFKPAANESAYSASKGALQILTKALAREFGECGYQIRVNSVNPAIVETPMLQRALSEVVERGAFASEEEVRTALLADYPLGRFATPDDVAKAIVFLASSDADYLTGTSIAVDGGETA
jgi:cyclopentanol dehydrogenase